MSENNNTFKNLEVLEIVRQTVREKLGKKYDETISLARGVIEKVMEANDENHYSAVYRMKNKTTLLDDPNQQMLFSAALMEIVEEKNLKPLK